MIRYTISFERLCAIMPEWKWLELEIGLKKSIITAQDIKGYALQILTEYIDKYDLVLELAVAKEDEVCQILERLCFPVEQQDESVLNKWIFAIIYYVYIYDRGRVFEIIEDVYVEFDYLKQLQNLISYMPCEDGKTIEERLEAYILDGERKYIKRNN